MGSGIAYATPKFNDVIIRRNSMKKKTWKKKWKKPKPDKKTKMELKDTFLFKKLNRYFGISE
jgi:hypothetical protein